MAEKMQFDLVSPERRVASVEARAVRIPGAEGDLTAMAGHAPVITTLRPGLLVVEMEGGQSEEFAVTGGFAEIGPDATTVLAEAALPRGEVTKDWLNDLVAEANRAHRDAEGDAVDAAAKLVADMVAMGDHMGIPVESRVPAP